MQCPGPITGSATRARLRLRRSNPTTSALRDVLAGSGEANDRARQNHQPGKLKMQNSEYQGNYFKQRYAMDPAFRGRCQQSSRNSQLKKKHGITLKQLEAPLWQPSGAAARAATRLWD